MNKQIQELYESHHHKGSRQNFAIWEKERGKIFSEWIGRDKQVLDLGCRDGTLTKYYSKVNKITGVDIDRKMLNKCKRKLNINIKHLNIYKEWPFSSRVFDVVVAGELLEHLYNPQDIVVKSYKVLKKGGMFIGSVPNFYHLKRRLLFFLGKPVDVFEDPTHVTVFGIDKLRGILKTEFNKVEIIGLGRKSHQLLTEYSPNLLAHTLLFKADN